MYFDGSLLSIIVPRVLWFALMNSCSVETWFPLALFLCAPTSCIGAVPLCLLRLPSPSCEKDLAVRWFLLTRLQEFICPQREHFLPILN